MFELIPFFIFASTALSSPTKGLHKRDDNMFVWGSVGDSWASGVSYSTTQHTDYDNNKNNCLRWKNSYGPLMEADETWIVAAQTFYFAACSGATLDKIVANPQGDNPAQMDIIGVGSPTMVTYHAGGNNCQFGTVVNNCIYQPPSTNYGPEYPDPSGKCAEIVDVSRGYINQTGDGGLYQDELNTVKDLLNHPSVKDNKDFKLYILGYAQFFNTNDNYCSDMSFAPVWNNPKLTVRLRTDINNAISNVNTILQRVADDVNDPRAKYIDISPNFQGHRFCEDNHSKNDQWYSTDVWLWNLNTPADDPRANIAGIEAWIANGTLPNGAKFNATGMKMGVESQASQTQEVDGQGSGGSTGDGPTWTQKPFHPKQGGTGTIKDYVIAQARADNLPGVKGVNAQGNGTTTRAAMTGTGSVSTRTSAASVSAKASTTSASK